MLTHPRSQDRGQPQLRATAQAQGALKARCAGLPPLGKPPVPTPPSSPAPSCEAARLRATNAPNVLAARFPKFFRPIGEPNHPLKVGIAADIFVTVTDTDRRDICNALADYCRCPIYHAAMIECAISIDLDGNPAELLCKSAADHASMMLLRMWRRR